VRSVFLDPKGKILAGTFEGTIFEMDSNSPGTAPVVLMRGHGGMHESNTKYSGELWGLSMHPSGEMYATVGDDRAIRVYNIADRKCIAHSEDILDCRGRACAWHPDGKRMACAQKDGKIKVVAFEGDKASGTLKEEAVFQHRTFKSLEQGGIDELKFNPAGDLLATGAHSEGKGTPAIDIIKTDDADPSKWKRVNVLTGHSSFINHMDWDADGKILKSTDGNPELLYWDATGAKDNIPSGATTFADVEWATFSTHVGWPVQGIFRKLENQVKQMDMTDVNMVDVNKGNSTIALGDDYGQVVLYKYPCTRKDDAGRFYGGHSSHVTNVKFNNQSSCLISTGGHDLSIFQWRCS